MKLNELRIGNLVTLCIINDEYMEFDLPIDSLQGDNSVRLLKENNSIGCFGLKQIKPIRITEEWLLKFGFKKSKKSQNGYYINEFEIEKHGDKFPIAIHGGESAPHLTQYKAHHTKNVHQLQNLYFALTGEELQIQTK